MLGVDLGELLLPGRDLVLREYGVNRTYLDAGVAVDALVRIDVELPVILEVRLGWMQSTGQTSTQVRSFRSMQGSVMTYVTSATPLRELSAPIGAGDFRVPHE